MDRPGGAMSSWFIIIRMAHHHSHGRTTRRTSRQSSWVELWRRKRVKERFWPSKIAPYSDSDQRHCWRAWIDFQGRKQGHTSAGRWEILPGLSQSTSCCGPTRRCSINQTFFNQSTSCCGPTRRCSMPASAKRTGSMRKLSLVAPEIGWPLKRH